MRRRSPPLAIALSLLSAPTAAQNGWAGTVTITNVIVEGDQVLVQGTGINNALNCSNGNFIVLGTSADQTNRFLSLAMTALSGGFKVDFWVQGCGGTSWGPAAIGYHMNLHR